MHGSWLNVGPSCSILVPIHNVSCFSLLFTSPIPILHPTLFLKEKFLYTCSIMALVKNIYIYMSGRPKRCGCHLVSRITLLSANNCRERYIQMAHLMASNTSGLEHASYLVPSKRLGTVLFCGEVLLSLHRIQIQIFYAD